ncbi:hypothetical protein [Pseudoduganella chitinolytica]|uniref:Uncharacterized protein n=1 Tax=Pseudoduganella chitinolytica TaxID=34070 RepID=A0ABY8BFL6_9BURK|nr:hypothetical protein [Pseudoduganella chitinolytica]WEF34694.1 hypothetical protein PX653_08020 [Pseudoduganella chitinolytica]
MIFKKHAAASIGFLAVITLLCPVPSGRFDAGRDPVERVSEHEASLSEAKFYGKGLQLGQRSKAHTITALTQFEASVKVLYGDLIDDLADLDDQPSSRLWREIYLRYAVQSAGDAMLDAERAFLESIGLRTSAPAPAFLGRYSFSSTEAAFLHSREFMGLLAGVAASVDSYVLPRIQNRTVKGLPDLFFPSLCFARVERREKSYKSADVSSFLGANPFRNLAIDSLFDRKYAGGPRTILTDSRLYSMDGARQSCGLDGEVDVRSGLPTIVLFSDDIAEVAYVKKRPELAPALRNETEVHEVLHTIARNSCAGLGTREVTVGNVVYSRRRINEALATIGTIAVMASTDNKFTYVTLFNQLILAGTYHYALTFELFYKELFSSIAKTRFDKLKRAADSGKPLRASDVPPYMKLSERPALADLGALSIDGRSRFVSVPYTYSHLSLQFDPLAEVSNAEVLLAAERALTAIRDVQLSLCGN